MEPQSSMMQYSDLSHAQACAGKTEWGGNLRIATASAARFKTKLLSSFCQFGDWQIFSLHQRFHATQEHQYDCCRYIEEK